MRRTALDGPLCLFLISAAIGLGVAYDRLAAWPKFCLIVGGLALYHLLARAPERIRLGRQGEIPLISWALGVFPALVTVFFLLTNDWARWAGKIAWLAPIGYRLAIWQPSFLHIRLNPNVAGGVIAAFLPLQWAAWRAVGRGRAWVGWLFLGLAAFGLLLSMSRGAWLALAAVLIAWGTWGLSGRIAGRRGQDAAPQGRMAAWLALLALGSVAIVLTIFRLPWGEQLWQALGERPTIWRNARDLAGDYVFTGLGLGGFPMAYASYILLSHVEYITHAHNLLLDVWLEQGLLGLVALVWLVGMVVWADAPASRWRPTALAALAVILLHGLVDDPFYGYGGWSVWLLFVPLGLLARAEGATLAEQAEKPAAWTGMRAALVVGGVAILLAGAGLLFPKVRAAWEVNLGALAQTQAELSVYRWPEWPIQDAVRRSPQVDLSPALAHYQTALTLDPQNAAAHRRLGQIALSQGDDEAARRHLQAAYEVAPSHRTTRQLLAESYAVSGEVEPALALWRTVGVSRQQLLLRAWWYASLGEEERAARLTMAAHILFGGSS